MRSVRFGDILAEPLRNGLTKPQSVRGSGMLMVGMREVFKQSRLSDGDMDRVPVTMEEIRTSSLSPGDLLFARQSLVESGAGKCALVLPLAEGRVFESHLIRARVESTKANSDFYFYYFNSPIGRQQIRSIVEQVAAAGIRGSDLANLRVPWPDLGEQERIAGVLRLIDDRIDGAERTAMLLQRLVEESYRELPEVQDGGADAVLGDICKRIVAKAENWGAEPLIDLGRIRPRRLMVSQIGQGSELRTSVHRFAEADVLFGAVRPYFHKVALAPHAGVTNASVMVLRASEPRSLPQLVAVCLSPTTAAYATRVSVGTKMPVTRWAELAQMPIDRLGPASLERLGRVGTPTLARVTSLVRQSNLLDLLRNRLLRARFDTLVVEA